MAQCKDLSACLILVVLHPLPQVTRIGRAKWRSREELQRGVRHVTGIAECRERAGVAEDFVDAADVCADARHTAAHGLQHRQAEALGVAVWSG